MPCTIYRKRNLSVYLSIIQSPRFSSRGGGWIPGYQLWKSVSVPVPVPGNVRVRWIDNVTLVLSPMPCHTNDTSYPTLPIPENKNPVTIERKRRRKKKKLRSQPSLWIQAWLVGSGYRILIYLRAWVGSLNRIESYRLVSVSMNGWSTEYLSFFPFLTCLKQEDVKSQCYFTYLCAEGNRIYGWMNEWVNVFCIGCKGWVVDRWVVYWSDSISGRVEGLNIIDLFTGTSYLWI